MGVPGKELITKKYSSRGEVNAGIIFAHTTLNENEKNFTSTLF